MSEQLDLTTPITTPSITYYNIKCLVLDWGNKAIVISLKGTNGENKQFSYDGDIAVTLMKALNKADLSVKSLHRRVLERLIADSFLPGLVSGSPE